jgi:hypothetical protein
LADQVFAHVPEGHTYLKRHHTDVAKFCEALVATLYRSELAASFRQACMNHPG